MTPSPSPVAWIFGGGIAGATAAHELLDRGFEVHLVEPARDPLDPSLPALGGVARSQWAAFPDPALGPARTRPLRDGDPLDARDLAPGEHGFRYFPGFYRHVFDTMRRTPTGAGATAFDRLVGTAAMWMAVKDTAGETRVARFPRERPSSLRELLDQQRAMLVDAGYTAADLALLTLKLFQYMTTSTERRAAEMETLTWWDFIRGDAYTPRCQDHLDRGPEVLGAMTARESDARTQGNCVVQLLIDQLLGRPLTDATLDGPTSEAWFDPWRAHLLARGAQLHVGSLTGFDAPPDDAAVWRPGVLLPRVEVDGETLGAARFPTAKRPHGFVLALPATAMMGLAGFLPEGVGETPARGVARRFLDAHATLVAAGALPDDPALREVSDFEKVAAWARAIESQPCEPARGAGPFRHLTGVQYFFPVPVQTGVAHALHMDQPWRLSSISQMPFWKGREVARGRCRAVLSVDLGALFRVDDDPAGPRAAWDCSADEIARRAWDQLRPSTLADGARGAEAFAWHVDAHLVFRGDGAGVARNLAPYLINAPGDWHRRPGRLGAGAARHRGYAVQNGAWVLAGTYLQTLTRLTTMESANESARHAVNGLLGALGVGGDPCPVWDPEEHEVPDLDALRALDARLFRDGYPHMVEILQLDALPAWLLP